MQALTNYLGYPFEVVTYNTHRWKVGNYIFSVRPCETGKYDTVYLFNILDENGISRGGGCWDSIAQIIEAAKRLELLVQKEASKQDAKSLE